MVRTQTQERFVRARLIEHIVQEDYFDEETDAADIALDELQHDDTRNDQAIAHAVAMRIQFP